MQIEIGERSTISYSPELYSSFPDIIRLPKGVLVCIFREGNKHHPTESRLVLAKSNDNGRKWEKEIFLSASLNEHGFVFNCPRINIIGSEVIIVCDTKSSIYEGKSKWQIMQWRSSDLKNWVHSNTKIEGMVPDRIVRSRRIYLMAYHITDPDSKNFIQMLALSRDECRTWPDRLTIAAFVQHDFCEASVVSVEEKTLYCYLRDNKVPVTRGYLTISTDAGMTWSEPAPLNVHMHRPVAGIKQYEPYAGCILGTYRNTAHKTIELFIQNINTLKVKSFVLDTESKESLYDFGYTGWIEFPDGSLAIVYYISGEKNPKICFLHLRLRN